ncbi:DNA polymerase III subunit delta' [Bordetella pertussis]|nr:DNA polymerase III subunit delta' [Bordetella pertussis]
MQPLAAGKAPDVGTLTENLEVRQAAARAQPAQLAETARWLSRQRGLATHPLNAKLFVHAALQRVVLSCQ